MQNTMIGAKVSRREMEQSGVTNQKSENILNLALSTPEKEREQTEELNVGFDDATKTWELIVRFSGNLRNVLEEGFPDVTMRELLGGFAILRVPENLVEQVIQIEEIEYVEKPKKLYFSVNRGKAASCFLPLQSTDMGERSCGMEETERKDGTEALAGCGILIAVVDSGIDFFHEDFRNEDGSSRILCLYDQVLNRVFTKEELDAALRMEDREEARMLVPSVDSSGHGTAVAGIAAGNGRAGRGRYRGAAYKSDLIIVRLGVAGTDDFPRTTQVMDGLDFVIRTSQMMGRPVAVNLSFGNTYGSHDGNGLLERYIDRLAETGRSVFVIGTGNEGDKSGHVSGRLSEKQVVELAIGPYETGFGVQLWKEFEDEFDIELTNPSGSITERVIRGDGAYELDMDGTKIFVYYGEPSPYLEDQEVYFEFLPENEENSYVESGIWKFTLYPRRVVDGRFDFWLPSSSALNRATRFLRPTPETTLTIPSTALRPISVGAYDDATNAYASFSGRGDTRSYQIPKPDLVAPGVGIVAPSRDGGYAPVTGTSFAAPFVTGAAALLMEWGIVRGYDPYLYGDKVKAYLKKGAKKLPGEVEYPNPRVGWGALCVADSIPWES